MTVLAFFQPALAAVEWIGFVVFLVIAFLGWIMNLFSKQNQPPPARRGRRQPPRPRDDRLQSEIDDFLREVGGDRPRRQQPARPARPAPRRQAQDDVAVEIVPERERRPQRRQPRPRSRPPKQPAPPTPTPKPKEHDLRDRHLVSQELGTTIGRHLKQFMQDDRVDNYVQQHLQNTIDSTVAQHLGQASVGDAYSQVSLSAPDTADQVRTMLQDRQGVRTAILVNEILSRPRALRNG